MVGSRLAQLRAKRGFSAGDLARALKISEDQIQRYETGERIPAHQLCEISTALRVSISALFVLPEPFEAESSSLPSAREGVEFTKLFFRIRDARLRAFLLDVAHYLGDPEAEPLLPRKA
jgi:transcriptional regulator with XRE-family HTH domain